MPGFVYVVCKSVETALIRHIARAEEPDSPARIAQLRSTLQAAFQLPAEPEIICWKVLDKAPIEGEYLYWVNLLILPGPVLYSGVFRTNLPLDSVEGMRALLVRCGSTHCPLNFERLRPDESTTRLPVLFSEN